MNQTKNANFDYEDSNRIHLVGRDGPLGWVDQVEIDQEREDVLVHLGNNRTARVPRNLLQRQEDGSFFLPLNQDQLTHQGAGSGSTTLLVIPVIEEELQVQKRRVESGTVQVTRQVSEQLESREIPLIHEEISVERVKVDRLVDQAPEVRYEGDVLVVPVVEEELAVEKRLRLKEEVRITRIKREKREKVQTSLRKEFVDVKRSDQEEHENKE